MSEKQGIAVAGSVLVDKICQIDAYPQVGELTQIRSIVNAGGGLVPNDAIDIKRLSPDADVFALGKVGDDAEGKYVTELLAKCGIDVSGIKITNTEKTSFTDVMSIEGGQRTFFTYAGASADFGYDDIDWDKLNCRMLHLGYFLLLKKVDEGDGLRILREASERGIETSIDLVSENSDRYSLVIPCLPYVDYLIINESEAGAICGIEPTEDNLPAIAKKLSEMGVRKKVIIHTPAVMLCLGGGQLTVTRAVALPKGFKKGSTGAGDAFCSGALVAIYKGKTDREILDMAQLSAIASLRAPDATSGMDSFEKLCEELGDIIQL